VKPLTPKKIVEELDRHIVGQGAAKKAVAVALRNRWRRQQLAPELRGEVMPKNILMIGPTGVGKTEIARRLASLARAPFLKVEASRYTEVGYHGRDVETMIRDLVEIAVQLVKTEALEAVREPAEKAAEERLVAMLLPEPPRRTGFEEAADRQKFEANREKMRAKLRSGELDEREVEISVEERPQQLLTQLSNQGIEEYGVDLGSMMGHLFPARSVTRKASVPDARRILQSQEAEKLVDREKILREGVDRAEQHGIVFVDEIDKIAVREGSRHGPDVSREGVQRDLLPIVEGSTVVTRYGPVKSHHMLFIAAGAFHISKPSDLIPELQGRFPIRVELSPLTEADFLRILTEPRNALTRQYAALLKTEGVFVRFEQDGLEEMASFAAKANATMQDIGARRLHTVIERVLEDVSFRAPDEMTGNLVVDRGYVRQRLKGLIEDEDLRKFIL
jgi:ATP-dependent HslUV protease ATP-binding subunit HslU